MTRTLYRYIAMDLVKVTTLALVALTLVMTVIGVIEPLSKRGLGQGQVAALFAYTLPMMLSFTLPIAALFAGTIAYGRLSQDNEFTACRASGVSTLSLLAPALVLGVIVTVASMILINYVAPKMTEMLARSIKANVMGIVARKLRMQNYIKRQHTGGQGKIRTQMIHADAVAQEGNQLTLFGVVAAEGRDPSKMRILAASKAHAEFVTTDESTYVRVFLVNPAALQTGGERIVRIKSQPFFLPVPDIAEEKPTWYNWNKLMRARVRPEVNSEIRGIMRTMRREMHRDLFHKDVVSALSGAKRYDSLKGKEGTYVVRAPEVKLAPDGSGALLRAVLEAGGGYRPVEVRLIRDGRTYQRVTGDSGRIWAEPHEITGECFGNIEVLGSVRVVNPLEGGSGPTRPRWSAGALPLPPRVLDRGKSITPRDMILGKKSLGRGLQYLPKLKERIAKLERKILGEMHSRLAFGLSCFLLVGVGSALGLIFRGGQVISAFAICVVPGALVMVLIIMGKRMVGNPAVSPMQGVAMIWAGIVALLVAEVAIYAKLARK